jgi:hypothetical protein
MNTDVNYGSRGGATPVQQPRRWPKVLVVLVLLGVVAAAAGYYFKFGVLKWSKPYQMALDKLKSDPGLAAQIGAPIQDVTWFPSGEIDNDPSNGTAHLFFDVAGAKSRAAVQLDARQIDGKWGLTQLTATPEGGSRLQINLGAESGLDEAPRFSP